MLETLEVQRIPKPAQMAAIPTPMYNRLCQTLLQCDPFDSHQTLQAIFINAKLITWRNQLPEATNRLQRVEATIAYLHDKYSAKQNNALISLLDVLRERISADDARHNELAGLASELTSTLTP